MPSKITSIEKERTEHQWKGRGAIRALGVPGFVVMAGRCVTPLNILIAACEVYFGISHYKQGVVVESNDNETGESGKTAHSASPPDQLPPPPPVDPSTQAVFGSANSIPTPSTKWKNKKFIAVAALAVVALMSGAFLVLGGGDSQSEADYELLAHEVTDDQDAGDHYLASLKDNQVVTSQRLGPLSYIDYRKSLSDRDSENVELIGIDQDLYFRGDTSGDDGILKVNKKSGEVTPVYKLNNFGSSVFYIADIETFIINEDGNCFLLPVGKSQTRVGSGTCVLRPDRIFTLKSSDDSTTVNQVNLDGTSKTKFTIDARNVDLHASGLLALATTSEEKLEIYNVTDGQRVYKSGDDETVKILDEATTSGSMLVAVEDDKDDETVRVGVLTIADGSGAFKELTKAYSASGMLSSKGSHAIIMSNAKSDGDQSIDLWDVSKGTSKPVAQGVKTIHEVHKGSSDQVALITDGDVIVGNFGGSVISRISGSFNYGSISLTDNAILVVTSEGREAPKSDLMLVKTDGPLDGDKGVVTLTLDSEGLSLNSSSMAVEGYVYYSETSDSYTEIYRQQLSAGSKKEKVAEGRLTGFTVLPSSDLYFWSTLKDNVASWVQAGSKPENKKTVSDRYVYLPIATRPPVRLLTRSYWSTATATAMVDADLRSCRENNTEVLKTGDTRTFDITRSTATGRKVSERQNFCVNAGSTITVISSSNNDNSRSAKYILINCSDADSSYSDFTYADHSTSTVEFTAPSDGKVYSCFIEDYNGYAYYQTFGMRVSIAIS